MTTILLFALLLPLTKILTAPPDCKVYIPAGEVLFPFNIKDPLKRAVAKFESEFDPFAENEYTKARGLMQITPIMIHEVNKICKLQKLPYYFTWNDAWDPYKSLLIWDIVQGYKNPDYCYDKAVRIWFGTGKQKHDGMTWHTYFNTVSEIMYQN